MNVVDKQAVTVVRKLWYAVADNSRAPKLINNVSQQLPRSSSNIFSMPLFDVRKPRWMHVQTRKQPMLNPLRFFRLRCTCSLGILISVGILLALKLTSSARHSRSKRFGCWANTGNDWDYFISWGHFQLFSLEGKAIVGNYLRHNKISAMVRSQAWRKKRHKKICSHEIWKIRSKRKYAKRLQKENVKANYSHFHHNNLLHQK